MDAVTQVFSQFNELKKTTIDLILLNQTDSFKLNTFFNGLTLQYEAPNNSFKCTTSYLRFMNKIFKQEQPYLVLGPNQQVALHDSFLDEMLRLNYSDLMANFFNFQFSSASKFFKFAIRLLKLTFTLLKKFDCGNPVSQLGVKQKNPRFDPMLNMVFTYLNTQNFQMLIDLLEIKEIGGLGPQVNNLK